MSSMLISTSGERLHDKGAGIIYSEGGGVTRILTIFRSVIKGVGGHRNFARK